MTVLVFVGLAFVTVVDSGNLTSGVVDEESVCSCCSRGNLAMALSLALTSVDVSVLLPLALLFVSLTVADVEVEG